MVGFLLKKKFFKIYEMVVNLTYKKKLDPEEFWRFKNWFLGPIISDWHTFALFPIIILHKSTTFRSTFTLIDLSIRLFRFESSLLRSKIPRGWPYPKVSRMEPLPVTPMSTLCLSEFNLKNLAQRPPTTHCREKSNPIIIGERSAKGERKRKRTAHQNPTFPAPKWRSLGDTMCQFRDQRAQFFFSAPSAATKVYRLYLPFPPWNWLSTEWWGGCGRTHSSGDKCVRSCASQ